jgi:hypothetical protein
MLTPREIKRLPGGVYGYLPLIACPANTLQFRPIPLPDHTKLIMREEAIVETYTSYDNAQRALCIYLRDKPPGSFGQIKIIGLNDVICILSHAQIAIEADRGASICDLLFKVQVVPFMCNYENQSGELCKLVALTSAEDKAPVRRFGDYLKGLPIH